MKSKRNVPKKPNSQDHDVKSRLKITVVKSLYEKLGLKFRRMKIPGMKFGVEKFEVEKFGVEISYDPWHDLQSFLVCDSSYYFTDFWVSIKKRIGIISDRLGSAYS